MNGRADRGARRPIFNLQKKPSSFRDREKSVTSRFVLDFTWTAEPARGARVGSGFELASTRARLMLNRFLLRALGIAQPPRGSPFAARIDEAGAPRNSFRKSISEPTFVSRRADNKCGDELWLPREIYASPRGDGFFEGVRRLEVKNTCAVHDSHASIHFNTPLD